MYGLRDLKKRMVLIWELCHRFAVSRSCQYSAEWQTLPIRRTQYHWNDSRLSALVAVHRSPHLYAVTSGGANPSCLIPHLSHRCTRWCAKSYLLPGQGGDEFAAEVGDVWDHLAPDQVGVDRETLKYIPKGFSSGLESLCVPGWCAHGYAARSAKRRG